LTKTTLNHSNCYSDWVGVHGYLISRAILHILLFVRSISSCPFLPPLLAAPGRTPGVTRTDSWCHSSVVSLLGYLLSEGHGMGQTIGARGGSDSTWYEWPAELTTMYTHTVQTVLDIDHASVGLAHTHPTRW